MEAIPFLVAFIRSASLSLDCAAAAVFQPFFHSLLGVGDDHNEQQQHHSHGGCKTDLLVGMGDLVHDHEVGRGVEAAAGDNIGHLEGGQCAGHRDDEVQHHDGADGGQDDVLEAVPCVGTVDLSSLVQNGVHRSDSTDEHDDVLADVFPDGAGHQHDVVDGLIPEPEGQLIHIEAHPAQQGIQHKAVGEEKLEDEEIKSKSNIIISRNSMTLQ